MYTDTDSIIFFATKAQWELYRRKFVPLVKTFGGMELEEKGHRALNVRPKKYVMEQKDGSYTWHANGIRAKQHVGVDVRDCMVNALRGETENG